MHRIFFKFCIHIVIGDEWYGIVNGQNPTIFDGVTANSMEPNQPKKLVVPDLHCLSCMYIISHDSTYTLKSNTLSVAKIATRDGINS